MQHRLAQKGAGAAHALGLCLPERQGLIFGHLCDRARSRVSGLIFSTSAILRACTVMGHGTGWAFALNCVVPCAFLRQIAVLCVLAVCYTHSA